jgi:hypothetical protein
MIEKVRNESTLEGLRKLEKSNDNLYNNGCLQGFEFGQIYVLIIDKIIEMEVSK